jgi:hypothetical protein
VQPPTEPREPATGEAVPYPNEILQVSRGRYLTPSGEILTQENRLLGSPTDLKANTRAYWEGRAAVAGYTLDELLD